jgi:hypothetical protein
MLAMETYSVAYCGVLDAAVSKRNNSCDLPSSELGESRSTGLLCKNDTGACSRQFAYKSLSRDPRRVFLQLQSKIFELISDDIAKILEEVTHQQRNWTMDFR